MYPYHNKIKQLGDITKINWFEVAPVDCVTGGSPCQDLSAAGKRAGLAGERSGLYMVQIRCVKELRQRDIQSGVGREGDPAPTLSTCDRHSVLAFDTTQITSPLNGNNPKYGDPCHPLAAGMHPPTVICIGNGQLNQMSMSEQANTLDTMHDQQCVMVSGLDCRNGRENIELSGTLQAKENGGQSLNYIHPVRVNQTVRRLTPLECERLQGYPDGWTDIGDWTDSKGKKHKAADSPRYKAIGNSIALPFWFWLLRRISAQYERPATLGSLFDGIGGFPLCWERCNGKGTALWASEIEEFPMAVTKVRFSNESMR